MAAVGLQSRFDLAVCLLAVGTARQYAWLAFPDELRGMASKGLGSLAALFLLALVLYPFVWLVLLPFRLIGIAVGGALELVKALVFLPARVLRGPRAV